MDWQGGCQDVIVHKHDISVLKFEKSIVSKMNQNSNASQYSCVLGRLKEVASDADKLGYEISTTLTSHKRKYCEIDLQDKLDKKTQEFNDTQLEPIKLSLRVIEAICLENEWRFTPMSPGYSLVSIPRPDTVVYHKMHENDIKSCKAKLSGYFAALFAKSKTIVECTDDTYDKNFGGFQLEKNVKLPRGCKAHTKLQFANYYTKRIEQLKAKVKIGLGKLETAKSKTINKQNMINELKEKHTTLQTAHDQYLGSYNELKEQMLIYKNEDTVTSGRRSRIAFGDDW